MRDILLFVEFARTADRFDRWPDDSNSFRFRHALEEHDLVDQILQAINEVLTANVFFLKKDSVADSILIPVPRSTKRSSVERSPEMKQSEKNKQLHFGLKGHMSADAESGLVDTACGAAGGVNDIIEAISLQAREVVGDYWNAGYRGANSYIEAKPGVSLHASIRPGKRKLFNTTQSIAPPDRTHRHTEVEHPDQDGQSAPGDQAAIQMCHGVSSQADYEHGETDHVVGAVQPDGGSQETGSSAGTSAPENLPQSAPHPGRCTSLNQCAKPFSDEPDECAVHPQQLMAVWYG